MRFRLVEAPTREWPPSVSTIDAYDKLGSQKEQLNFLKTHILPHQVFKKIFGIRQIVINCILKYGLDPKRNPFLNFLTKLTVEMPDAETYKQKMQYIYAAYENKHMKPKDLQMPVLNNSTLYSRSYKDFQYTLNAFRIFSDKRKAGVYLKNTENANVSQFMDGDKIKPAGLDGKGGPDATIYNIIEGWSDNGNEYSVDEIAQRKEQEAEAEKRADKNGEKGAININVSGSTTPEIEWSYEYFKEIFEKAFTNKSDYDIKLPNKNTYLEKAFSTFMLPSFEMPETHNKLYKSSTGDVKDADVSKFGDAHQIDTPIPLVIKTKSDTVPGIFVFHQFVPMDNASKSYYNTLANKNLGNLKRHLNKVSPTDDEGVSAHIQTIINAFSDNGVVGLSHK